MQTNKMLIAIENIIEANDLYLQVISDEVANTYRDGDFEEFKFWVNMECEVRNYNQLMRDSMQKIKAKLN